MPTMDHPENGRGEWRKEWNGMDLEWMEWNEMSIMPSKSMDCKALVHRTALVGDDPRADENLAAGSTTRSPCSTAVVTILNATQARLPSLHRRPTPRNPHCPLEGIASCPCTILPIKSCVAVHIFPYILFDPLFLYYGCTGFCFSENKIRST